MEKKEEMKNIGVNSLTTRYFKELTKLRILKAGVFFVLWVITVLNIIGLDFIFTSLFGFPSPQVWERILIGIGLFGGFVAIYYLFYASWIMRSAISQNSQQLFDKALKYQKNYHITIIVLIIYVFIGLSAMLLKSLLTYFA